MSTLEHRARAPVCSTRRERCWRRPDIRSRSGMRPATSSNSRRPISGRPASPRCAPRWRKRHFLLPPSRASASMRPARWWCSTPAADPLTVSTSGDQRRNVIVWMDHRAIAEARLVNDTHDDVLRYVGGSISPEMEIPKLLWLKRHLPSTYHARRAFLRSRRLSLVSRHRVDRAFDLHGDLQVEFSRPRTALERQLFRAHRSWRSRLGRLRENRKGHRRAGHAAGQPV